MIKVIIADDESAVHEQLRLMIPWDELGWEIVGHAYNGEEARRLAETHRPHLVLTDIKMPLMDGLSFMKWLEQSGLNTKVIVLSGYGDFDFSRSAFLLGAYDYLLKPVQEPELLMTLSRAIEQIHKESRTMTDRINDKAVLNRGIILMRDEFFSEMIVTTSFNENEMIVRAEHLLVPVPDSGYAVVLVNFTDLDEYVYQQYEGDRSLFYFAARNVMNEKLGPATFVCRNLQRSNEFILLYPGSARMAKDTEYCLKQLQQTLRQFVKVKPMIGISGWKQRLGKLPAAYAEALNALETLRAGDDPAIAFYRCPDSGRPRGPVAEGGWGEVSLLTEMLFQTGSLREGERLLGKLESFLSETLARLSIAEWKKAAVALLGKLEQHAAGEETTLLVHEARIGVQELRFNQVNDLLLKLFEAKLHTAAGDSRAKSGKQLVEAIRTYIDAHFRTVTLEEVAQRFYLNKNYFCSLFKGVMGKSFNEYVTGVRMETAKLLLAESELKTFEIADRVGYGDQRYFSQVFRKYTGLQPTQYRQMVKEAGKS